MEEKVIINGNDIGRDPYIILVGRVNSAKDKGNVQVQFGEEHANPSMADLQACRPTSRQLYSYAKVVAGLEAAEDEERQKAAQLAEEALRKEQEREAQKSAQA